LPRAPWERSLQHWQAIDMLAEGKADIILLAREYLRDPHFVPRAANEPGVAVKPVVRYELGT
jgi:2,4-dienoyl-CoA reductase-like NADH-dependent reductase (Old Yellow Enzyme family)